MSDYDAVSRFTGLIDAYSKYRFRDYPSKVLDAVFARLGDPRDLIVADVGAGTGISARLLASRGSKVIAIEPNAHMRNVAPNDPRVEWRDGTAEATGLDAKSVDIVATFQSFHWFDPEATIQEFRRIARSRFVSVQYEHEESDKASAAFNDLVRKYSIDDSEALRRHALEIFSVHAGRGLRTLILDADWPRSLEELSGYVDSLSFVPHEGEAAGALRQEVEDVFFRYAVRGRFNLTLRIYVLALDL